MRTLALTCVALLADPDFAGCGTGVEIPGEPTPLPVTMGTACEIDADCVMGCTQARCIGSRCAEREPLDADGDGLMPAPCGDDCDDADPNAFPGGSETCDRRDDDCDGTVDEAAPAFVNTFHVTGGFDEAVALPWGEDILVLSSSEEGTIDARTVTTDGTELRARSVELPLGGARRLRGVAAGPADRHMVVNTTDATGVDYRVVQRTAAGAEVVEGPATLFEAADRAGTIELAAFGDSFAVHYTGVDPLDGVYRRLVRATPDGANIHASPQSIAPLAFASDGTNLAVVDAETFEVTFVDRTGTEIGRYDVRGGSLAWPRLQSGDGVVYALRFQTHPEIVSVDAPGTISTIAESVVDGNALEFFRAGNYFAVGGADTPSSAWTFEVIDEHGETLAVVELPTTEPVQRLSAVPWRDGVAIVAGLAQAFELGVVTRCTPAE